MKCIILAGGSGDRLWPLSRKNNPKQFIRIQNNHSIFQETIARNMAFCDEFIIVTNQKYRSIVENQMKAFQGLTYQVIYESIGRKTTAAIVLAALQLPLSEIIFVAAADHFIQGEAYKDNLLRAKELAMQGYLVTFGMDIEKPDTRFGYICHEGETVLDFTEKPDQATAKVYQESGKYFLNSGLFVFRNGDFQKEFRMASPYFASLLESSYYMRKTEGNAVSYDETVMEHLPAEPIEKTLFEKTKKAKVVHGEFQWQDLGSLDDLDELSIPRNEKQAVISNKCKETTVFNQSEKQLVLVNHLDDVMVVNTEDAIYIGKKGESNDLKEIIRASSDLWSYFDKSSLYYRNWGQYEVLEDGQEQGYQVRKVTVLPGKTIYGHFHENKKEAWSIIAGLAKVVLNGEEGTYSPGDHISISCGDTHQISCISEKPLVFIETATGLSKEQSDLISVESKDLSDVSLGYSIEPIVKLAPAFKDYLWGGTKLKTEFHKKCDYDIVAESWELSAHPDGQSIVATGKYKGLLFGEYLKKIGAESLGWKYQSFRAFPLLVKLIDAKKDLSIQVHPDDEYALVHENEYGKSEMWYIIDCEPDSIIYCGFKEAVSRETVKEHIEKDTLLSLLNEIPVKKGQTYLIPAGTIHAIGKGNLILEVQQNSNSTYRVYDYNRVDRYGNFRRLDIEKALDVLDYSQYQGDEVSLCKYFECKEFHCEGELSLPLSEESFLSLVVLEGEGSGRVGDYELDFKKGDCFFLPENSGKLKVSGKLHFVTARI